MENKEVKKKKSILQWIFTIFFGLCVLAFFPSIASLLFTIVTFALCPAKKVRTIWDRIVPKSTLRTILIAGVAFIAIMISPTGEEPSELMDSNSAVIEFSVEEASDELITPTPKPTEVSTATPELTATPEPTQVPTPTPEPTQEPTPTPEPAATPEPTTEPTLQPEESGTTYVLNTNTKKFHYENCRSVKQMKEKNKAYHTGTREECIDMGYEPCGNCHP